MKSTLLCTLFCSLILFSCHNDDITEPIFPELVSEFRANLSELNLFVGDLRDLNISSNAFEYKLSTALHTDFANKLRLIAIPTGTSIMYDGDGLPLYPDGTVMAKTFYYNNNEQDLSAGRRIIETRVLIRQGNVWHIGNYVWNETQDDAILDEDAHTIPITWTNTQGIETSIDYEIPNYVSCVMCHQNNGSRTPIGPKLRSMNLTVDGENQLQRFIDEGYLTNAPNPSSIGTLPNWKDNSLSDEIRTRAYLDMNCAHCHAPGGHHNMNFYEALDLRYETTFEESNILEKHEGIISRFSTSISGYSMPFIGVTIKDQEAIDLIVPYLETLE